MVEPVNSDERDNNISTPGQMLALKEMSVAGRLREEPQHVSLTSAEVWS